NVPAGPMLKWNTSPVWVNLICAGAPRSGRTLHPAGNPAPLTALSGSLSWAKTASEKRSGSERSLYRFIVVYSFKANPRPLRAGLGWFLSGAGAGQDIGQAVIAFMAGVLIQGAFHAAHDKFARPRLSPHRWILYRELILNRFGVDALQLFHDVQIFIG